MSSETIAPSEYPNRFANCGTTNMNAMQSVAGDGQYPAIEHGPNNNPDCDHQITLRESGAILGGVLLVGLATLALRFGLITYYVFIGLALWLVIIVTAIFSVPMKVK